MARRCAVPVGTSGWHYAHWRGPFYPPGLKADALLAHYVRHFDTVEVNNSFYRLPPPETFAAWRAATPPGFLFAVKGSRYVTHLKKLREPAEGVARLLASATALGEKLGPILFQLPPRWHRDTDRLAAFLQALPPGHRYTVEFRDPTWYDPSVYRLLERYGAALCVYDLNRAQSPIVLTAPWTYVRLHGPGGAYEGSYSDEALATWARRIDVWCAELDAVYVYFDNDQAGHAVHDARRLRERLGLRLPEERVVGAS